MLTGCDVTSQDTVQAALRAVSSFNDRVQALMFRPNHLAPTYSEAQVVKPPRFNAYYGVEDVDRVDGATWKLELAGRIADKKPWTVQQFYTLPEQEWIIRHICVEGWDYIGQWSGESAALPRAGRCGPQSEVCRLQMRRRLQRQYRHGDGAPSADNPGDEVCAAADRGSVRFPPACARRPSSASESEMDHGHRSDQHLPGGYWEDRGFNWFAGI
jgi:hypothetical protein